MIKALNTALYKTYLNKKGFSIGQPEDFYRLTEDINSLFFTFQVIKMIKED